MPNTKSSSNQPAVEQSPSHGKLVAVIVAAALVIVLAVLSAFVWPGWALSSHSGAHHQASVETRKDTEPTKPSIKAVALPGDSSQLLKAMPDSVLNYARVDAKPSEDWKSVSPLEEYAVSYSTGAKAKDVALHVAQWPAATDAKRQYDALVATMTGDELASGNVKVSGNTTGSYLCKGDASGDKGDAVFVWQNDTAVFRVSGRKDAVLRFTRKFPL